LTFEFFSHGKPYSELYAPVYDEAPKFHLQWRFVLKIGSMQKWLKMQTRNLN
jgi:hypothetical protein